jgi:hypothetical protein
VCECGATVVLQWAKNGIGIDLIAGADQVTASIVITQIVALGSDRAGLIENISSYRASFQNSIDEFYRSCGIVDTATTTAC